MNHVQFHVHGDESEGPIAAPFGKPADAAESAG